MMPPQTRDPRTRPPIPRPARVGGWQRVSTLSLPSVILSLVSMGVLGTVFGLLAASAEMRAFFRLPIDPVAVAAAAAFVAWAVAWVTGHRPSPVLARVWVLALALLATVVASALPLPALKGAQWGHASSVSLLAASLTLLPRLLPLSPASPWLGRLVPASVLGALLLVVLPVLLWAQGRVEDEREETRAALAHLRETRREVETLVREGGPLLVDHPGAGEETLRRLGALSAAGKIDDGELWRRAELLGIELELSEAGEALILTLLDALSPPRAPDLARRRRGAAWYDPVSRRWIADPDFPRASENVAIWYREMVRLFRELTPLTPLPGDDGSPAPRAHDDFVRFHQNSEAHLRSRLGELLRSWESSWIVLTIPGHEDFVGQGPPELRARLQAELDPESEEPLRPARLWRLMQLSEAEAENLAAIAPGCLSTRYQEGSYEYTRVDCDACAPAPEGGGAVLAIEMRLVFKNPSEVWRNGHRTAVETYFLFPVPPGVDEAGYPIEVMNELAAAAREDWRGEFRVHDRGGVVAGGFSLIEGHDELRVLRGRLVPFLGVQKAVEVRAEWR